MSTVAKIFIVLNFVLAAVFLGSAAAFLGHADNWKVKHLKDTAALSAEIGTLKQQKAEVTADKDKLSGAVGQAVVDRDLSRSQADVLKTAYDQIKKSYDELNGSLANESKALQIAQTTIANSRTLVDELQKERQTLIDGLAKATDEKNAAVKMQNQLALNLEQETMAKQDALAKLTDASTSLQRTTFELSSIKAANPGIGGSEQPWQTAKVLAADNGANIVVVSLGAEDGVKEGFKYTLSRGNQYVATVQITNVQAKQAAGKVLTGMSKSPVQAGDDAMTSR